MKDYRDSSIYIKAFVAVGELVILNALLYLMLHFRPDALESLKSTVAEDFRMRVIFAVANMAYLLSLSWVGIVLDQRTIMVEVILQKVTKVVIALFGIMFASLYMVHLYVPISFLLLYVGSLFISFAIWRISSRMALKSYRSHGGNTKTVIILGAGTVANELYTRLVSNISYGYKFLGFFDDRAIEDYKVRPDLVKGKLSDVNDFLDNNGVNEVYCALPAGDDRKALPIINYAEKNCVRCYIVPDFKRFIRKRVNLTFLESIPIVSLRNEPLLSFSNRLIKRAFDFSVSLLFTVTIFPFLFVILGLAIKLSSPGPIFFKQKRTGENGKDFLCYKFRTMQVNKDADKVQATKNDARVTKIGAFMRKTNLDEMPQFLNVLIGNMSLVGPRPHMLKHTEMYSALIDQYMLRHLAKPGITGWAQVTGFRGETKTVEEMEGRVKQDVWYIENWSFYLDLKIMWLTVYNMIRGDKQAY